MKIAFFVTCLAEQFVPRSAIAVVRVLELLGHEVVFPQRQTCCGQPHFNNGFHAEARCLARRMLDVFEDAGCVVTPSGSCAAMVHEHFPALLTGAQAEPARRLVERTYEFVAFLTRVAGFDPRAAGVAWEGTATWHYSCHLRGIGLRDEVPALLRGIEGLDFRPLENADECCGFGGAFALKQPELSAAMAGHKVAAIARTGAETVVSNDTGCTMQLAGACRRAGLAVRFLSLAEILAEGLGLLPRDGGPA